MYVGVSDSTRKLLPNRLNKGGCTLLTVQDTQADICFRYIQTQKSCPCIHQTHVPDTCWDTLGDMQHDKTGFWTEDGGFSMEKMCLESNCNNTSSCCREKTEIIKRTTKETTGQNHPETPTQVS